MKNIKLLIVEDRDIIKDALKMVLNLEKNIQVTGEAADGKEAMNLISKNSYDVVLMDINMPNMNGIEATKKIFKINPNIKVLANSLHASPYYIKEMIKAGAYGFITKGDNNSTYVEAINSVSEGAIFLSDEINSRTYDKVLAYLKYPATA